MDNQTESEKKKRPVLDHVALTGESIKKIENWLAQVETKKKGVKISRKDFLNWLVEKIPENLSGGDVSALIAKFYDEERFLRQLLREVKRAKENGDSEPALDLYIKPKKTNPK